jgi:hypothetical protein
MSVCVGGWLTGLVPLGTTPMVQTQPIAAKENGPQGGPKVPQGTGECHSGEWTAAS